MPRHTDNTWLERIAGYLSGGGSPDQAANVQGNVGAGATDEGDPVKIGGVRSDGTRGDAQLDDNDNFLVSLGTALDEDIDAITTYDKGYIYTRLSADGVVSDSPIGLAGYYVEASGTGVISLYDNASAASGNAMLALSKSVTTNDLVVLETPILMTNGVFFDLVSGTATVSVLTRKMTSA